MRVFIVLCVCGLLVACGNVTGKPLPMVKDDAPSWPLASDRLNAGMFPE
jgi:hypothetical protein